MHSSLLTFTCSSHNINNNNNKNNNNNNNNIIRLPFEHPNILIDAFVHIINQNSESGSPIINYVNNFR